MARLYGSYPWIHGDCEECPPGTVHDNDWIVPCAQCLRGICVRHTVDGCSICGYPYCHRCFRNHVCHRDALLRACPELKCRFCDRPQDTGNGQSRCEYCLKSACVGLRDCASQLFTTHCSCCVDLCGKCASWHWVARTARRRIASLDLEDNAIPTPSQVERYICNECWRLHGQANSCAF